VWRKVGEEKGLSSKKTSDEERIEDRRNRVQVRGEVGAESATVLRFGSRGTGIAWAVVRGHASQP